MMCEVAGCGNESVTLLPVANYGAETLPEIAASPAWHCCAEHEELLCERYTAGVVLAIAEGEKAGRPLLPEDVQRVCDQLQSMRNPRARAVQAFLAGLPGTTRRSPE
ncbi:hypothetical protein AS188_15670 (plasmid) [Kocuria flava]|uniref:Uncharacterized protein n=1 Tax=Kocuria flava TaxID=446860 RepID=A0A0U3HUP9_9MICC|nr:hypothetical protein AS188_15670 [Kocuria flava]GEO93584.1 hypothetical protein KFL01_28900 [Kocuria flava]